jgi:hypothetical protein
MNFRPSVAAFEIDRADESYGGGSGAHFHTST